MTICLHALLLGAFRLTRGVVSVHFQALLKVLRQRMTVLCWKVKASVHMKHLQKTLQMIDCLAEHSNISRGAAYLWISQLICEQAGKKSLHHFH